MEVGDKIKFKKEKQKYTIQACNYRYFVCTKPMNAQKTVLYTIVDLVEQCRGTENLILSMGFETREKCEECLQRLIAGETEVSHRNRIPIDLENWELAPTDKENI